MKFSIDFVLKVNETFHNIEADEYFHPECVQTETHRWQEIGKLIGKEKEKITILDIGSGLGFVPLQIAPHLKEKDLLICSDLSTNLLEICKKRIADHNFRCRVEFLKLDGKSYNIDDLKVDFITMNSVLHHIPNFTTFFKEINRILKIGGKLIIGHEPNKYFLNNSFLWYNYRIVKLLYNPKEIFLRILKKFSLYKINNSKKKIILNERLNLINKTLLSENVISTPLSLGELTEIVDFHSPTAGGFHRERGIDISNIITTILTNFKIEFFESYNHILKLSNVNKFTKLYDSILNYMFPDKGAIFFTILKKNTH